MGIIIYKFFQKIKPYCSKYIFSKCPKLKKVRKDVYHIKVKGDINETNEHFNSFRPYDNLESKLDSINDIDYLAKNMKIT
jgi:hypothetical protein